MNEREKNGLLHFVPQQRSISLNVPHSNFVVLQRKEQFCVAQLRMIELYEIVYETRTRRHNKIPRKKSSLCFGALRGLLLIKHGETHTNTTHIHRSSSWRKSVERKTIEQNYRSIKTTQNLGTRN